MIVFRGAVTGLITLLLISCGELGLSTSHLGQGRGSKINEASHKDATSVESKQFWVQHRVVADDLDLLIHSSQAKGSNALHSETKWFPEWKTEIVDHSFVPLDADRTVFAQQMRKEVVYQGLEGSDTKIRLKIYDFAKSGKPIAELEQKAHSFEVINSHVFFRWEGCCGDPGLVNLFNLEGARVFKCTSQAFVFPLANQPHSFVGVLDERPFMLLCLTESDDMTDLGLWVLIKTKDGYSQRQIIAPEQFDGVFFIDDIQVEGFVNTQCEDRLSGFVRICPFGIQDFSGIKLKVDLIVIKHLTPLDETRNKVSVRVRL